MRQQSSPGLSGAASDSEARVSPETRTLLLSSLNIRLRRAAVPCYQQMAYEKVPSRRGRVKDAQAEGVRKEADRSGSADRRGARGDVSRERSDIARRRSGRADPAAEESGSAA